jgi:hypothetical protein
MSEDEMSMLEDPDEWDLEHAERQQPPRNRRAIVSVAFKPQDFAMVSAVARERGQPVSQFIRQAALESARGDTVRVQASARVVEVVTITPSRTPPTLTARSHEQRLSALRLVASA